jgi:hypothetical protein
MGSQTSINSITSYNSGIPGNSWELLPIPSYYTIPEFRAELDDRMGSQTSINSITSYNSGSGGASGGGGYPPSDF